MKVLITGGSGFIGTNLIEYFESKYDNLYITNVDIVSPKKSYHDKYWINLDIMDHINLERIVKKSDFDIVIHLAARTDINDKNQDSYLVNTRGTLNLINALKKSHTIKKVIFTSSMLVCHAGYMPLDDDDYAPTTAYGKSKSDMEDIIKKSGITVCWSIVRPTSIWGPGFIAPYKNFFEMVLKGLFFHPGDKACTKTYGYIGNLVYQIDKLLRVKTDKIDKKVFYLGDEPATNIYEWADEIKLLSLGKKNHKLPYFLFKILAIIGDILKIFNINFPMTSFRLNNMTTDNIINLKHLNDVVGKPPFKRKEATIITLNWLENENKKSN